MDPNETLRLIRKRLVEFHDPDPEGDPRTLIDSIVGLVSAVENLDGWLSAGGFLPTAWAANR